MPWRSRPCRPPDDERADERCHFSSQLRRIILNCRPRARRPCRPKSLFCVKDPNERNFFVRRGPWCPPWPPLPSLAACGKTQQAAAPAAADKPRRPRRSPTVNGTPISRAEFDVYVKSLLQGKQQELTPSKRIKCWTI